jgi:hypothetical protein
MANLTLNGWTASVAAGTIESLPLQDFESALVLAETFLGTQGGWNPDDVGEPTGPGVPVSGIDLATSILLITLSQRSRIYRGDITGTLNFRIIMNENLATGLDSDTVLLNFTDRLEELVRANINKTNLEFVDIPSFSGNITNGETDAVERVSIQNIITTGGRITEPKALALSSGRAEFNLDNTWNVQYLYTEQNASLFVMILKYTDTSYSTIDSMATNRFGITLDPVSYRTTNGTVLPA